MTKTEQNDCMKALARLARALDGNVFSLDTEDGPFVATAYEVWQEAIRFLEEAVGTSWREMGGDLPDPWLFLEHAGVKIWRAGKNGHWVEGFFTPDLGSVNINDPFGAWFSVNDLVATLAEAGLITEEESNPSDEEQVKVLMAKAIDTGLLTQDGLSRR